MFSIQTVYKKIDNFCEIQTKRMLYNLFIVVLFLEANNKMRLLKLKKADSVQYSLNVSIA